MINAKEAYNIALAVRREPVESRLLTAINAGKFFEYFNANELPYEVFVYLSYLGYTVKPGLSNGYVVSWDKQE